MHRLPAGQELDILVAIEVMGWAKVECDGVYYWSDPNVDDWHTGHIADERNCYGTLLEDVKPWSPSTDIAVAWDVIAKLDSIDRVRAISLGRLPVRESIAWSCVVTIEDGSQELEIFEVASTAQLAICHAALAVLGYK